MQQEEASAQASLFGGASGVEMGKPRAGSIEPYGDIEKLNIEKEMVGLYITGHPLDQYKFEMDFLTTARISQLKDDLKLLQGRDLKIGGVVTSVQHRMSKKGNPFGQITIEDYTDSFQFFLFGETYLKFKSYLETGWFLYITANIQNRWNSEELEVRFQNIEYLGEIREKMTAGIELRMQLNDINEYIVSEISDLATKYPGNSVLKLNVLGMYEDRMIDLQMLSRKITIEPSNELIRELESLDNIQFKILQNN
jgi:DNA polymerase-3 subunit alpha